MPSRSHSAESSRDATKLAPPSPRGKGAGGLGSDFPSTLTLHPAQHAFLHASERFSFYVGGIGAGKTVAGAVRAISRALDQPGSLGLVGAPTYPMLRDVTQRTFFELLPEGLIEKFHKVEGHLTLTNGSEVLFRSLDLPDRVRGLNLAWFWLDEAPLCGYYAWQVLKGRLRQEGFETAGWATGTPHGRDGFYRDFEARPRPHHLLIRASTMENAAHLPEGYVEDLGLSGALYEQEVLGLFTAFAGLVYPFQADTNGHVRAPVEGQTFARVIGGIDWGYTNPTAAVVFGLDGDDRAWQLDEFYQRRAPLDGVVLPALVELTKRHGVRVWYAGPDEPEHIAALNLALREERLPSKVVAAEDSVRAGIQTVLRQLTRRSDGTLGLYVAPSCRYTIAEYGSYQYPSDPDPSPASGMDLAPLPPVDLTPAFGHPSPLGEGTVIGTPSPSGEVPPLLAGEGGRGVRSDPSAGVRSELPLKANDHAMDATRYALHSALRQVNSPAAWMRSWLPARGEKDASPAG